MPKIFWPFDPEFRKVLNLKKYFDPNPGGEPGAEPGFLPKHAQTCMELKNNNLFVGLFLSKVILTFAVNRSCVKRQLNLISKTILTFAVNRYYVKSQLNSMNQAYRQSKTVYYGFFFIFHQRLCRQTNLIKSCEKVMTHRHHVIKTSLRMRYKILYKQLPIHIHTSKTVI